MTNPDNIVRVRARNGGRASVYEANAWCQNWTTGFVEGSITQNTSADMNVLVNGSPSKPSVAIAASPAPYNIALDIVGQKAIAITAPATNSRYAAIVAYTDDLSLATTEDTVTGSPASCGLIVVNGTTAANPTYPTDATIRTAITADGATGSQAAYVVLAYVLVASDTTAITNTLITNTEAVLRANSVATASILDGAITSGKLDWGSVVEVAGSGNNVCYKFGSGLMIAAITKTQSITYAAWGDIYETECVLPPDYAAAFTSAPAVSILVTSSGLECWVGIGSGRTSTSNYNGSATRGPGAVCMRAGGSGTNVNTTITWIAVGTWK